MIDVVTYALLKKYLKGGAGGSGSGDGAPGKSAYEIALENGFSGTQQEWLESLKGKSATVSIGENGYWYVDGVNTNVSALGENNMIRINSEQIQDLFD